MAFDVGESVEPVIEYHRFRERPVYVRACDAVADPEPHAERVAKYLHRGRPRFPSARIS